MDFARKHDVYLVAGVAERDGAQLYDTAVLVGPDGLSPLPQGASVESGKAVVYAGQSGLPVFDTPIGRIGMLVCWDIWFRKCPAYWRSKARYHL